MDAKSPLDTLLDMAPNLILGMKKCGDCTKAIGFMIASGLFWSYCPRENFPDIVAEVAARYNHKTFPAVFINKKFIGDENQLQAYLQIE